jgi:hypothetical protein
MTRLEAIKKVRRGESLEVYFNPEYHKVTSSFLVAVHYMDICDYPRHKRPDHAIIGPIHCLFSREPRYGFTSLPNNFSDSLEGISPDERAAHQRWIRV